MPRTAPVARLGGVVGAAPSVQATAYASGAALSLVEVVDQHEGRRDPGRGAGDESDAQVERDLWNGTEPEADADADDQRSEDEQEPV